jgi:transposase
VARPLEHQDQAHSTVRSNARSESLNRIAKLEARLAYGFRNPANQRRRVRIACTRGARRKPAAPQQEQRTA